VDCFLGIADEEFWYSLASPEIADIVINMEPAQYSVPLDDEYIDEIAAAFGQIIDSKSSFTAGHSSRVSIIADALAGEMGYAGERRKWLKRGALLHDVGKLGVSNSLLDKPGRLTDAEFRNVQHHALYTGEILARIDAFGMLAEIAQAHHERLDGKGYPFGLKGDEISMDTRLITIADIFDAITAERPYRGSTPVDETLAIMHNMVDVQIDRGCFEALCDIAVKLPQPEPLKQSV
jgi:putative nucleotidyltransferase with HDIG domain